ncbi:agglutinin biogenesis protein MshP [Duganella sp. FT94W]|uniref:Agglutinin biogenesis protein MshP n=2 Tax=Duganella lactea TaxID=2692173 RepID=A0ABW9V5K4_9BURK|nr:agglutinin biogenesis protein MshP [Duganella lactea]
MRLRRRQQSAGVAMVTAIFLVVVVAGLAVAAVTLSTAQQDASARDLLAQRAYQAAKAGVEWAAYQGVSSDGQPAVRFGCTSAVPNPAARNLALPPNTTLSAFTVTVRVTCAPDFQGVAGGGAQDPTAGHVIVESTACNQPAANGCPNPAPGTDYVQRVITVQL